MKQHPSYQSKESPASTPARLPVTAEPTTAYRPGERYADRACCCPAQPAVIAVIPAAGGRPAPTDLLLCGHHYRASKAALAACGATILDTHGHPLPPGAWAV